MANTKEYKIVINGLTESINAVDSLNKQLDKLEQRMRTINATRASSGGGSSSSRANTALSEEERVQKEINKLKQQGQQLDAKIAASQDEIYKRVDATKQLYKETIADQKAIAAQERLTANAYTNTMVGMKQKLADLKAVIQTTDLSDNDGIKKMTEQANELTNKLKELEEAYGQFGRNVGNYKSAFDGMEKVSVTIGGVTKEFDSLRQATRAISNQMGVLESQGKQDTQMYKELERELGKVSKAQLRLNSAMKDAKASSKVMDDILDTMESFTAIGQLSQGFSTLFGFDDSALERQIAKLVALQNVLKGIEKIRQQMNTKEGIGKIFANASKGVDQFVANLAGAEVRMGKIVGSSKETSIALNRLSTVLKGVGGVAVVGGIMLAMESIDKLVEDFKRWKNGGYEAGTATDVLTSQLKSFNKQVEILKNTDLELYFRGLSNYEEYTNDVTKDLITQIHILTHELGNLEKIDFSKATGSVFGGINIGYGKTEDEALLKAEVRFDKLAKKLDKLEHEDGSVFMKWAKSLLGLGEDVDKLEQEFQQLGEGLSKNLLIDIRDLMTQARKEIADTGTVSEQTRSKINQLSYQLQNNPTNVSLLENVDKFSKKGQYYVQQINTIKDAFIELGNALGSKEFAPDYIAQLEIDSMKESEEKIKKQNDLNKRKELAEAGDNTYAKKLIEKKYQMELDESLKAYRKTKKQETDQKKKEETDAQNEINELRIQLMREGLEKEVAALREEQRQRIKEIQDSGIKVAERVALTNEVYNKKVEKLTNDWAIEMKDIYDDLLRDITRVTSEITNMQNSTASSNLDNQTKNKKDSAGKTMIGTSNDTSTLEAYYKRILEIEKEAAAEEARIARERLFNEKQANIEEEKLRHERLVNLDSGEYAKRLEAGKITQEQFNELIERENAAHYAKLEAIDAQYAADSEKILQDSLDRKETAYSSYYQSVIATIRKEQDDISNEMSKAEVKDSLGIGVINIKATQKNYDALVEKEKESISKIKAERAKLFQDKGNMDGEDFLLRKSELDAAENAAMKTLEDLEKKQKEVIPKFIGQIAQYASQLGSALSSMLQAFGDYADQQYENEINEIEKDLEKYEELLDKQKEITEQHKSEVDSIEDELATARGDRRQKLIDQLNAEMAAQRSSLAEEKRIEKEEQKLKDKKDREEKKRLEAQKKQQKAQAIINGAVAFMNALAQQPIWLGIAMAAMTAIMTAAQIATIDSQKYADGGVIQGRSHAQGGVKVLGGQAEVEGQEFITNKRTTSQNVDLLYYINSKKKKLDLSDFIEFYASGKTTKNISPTRRVFADGGQIPTLRGDIDINGRLLTAFEDYSNRPVQVAVVDINERQAAVRNVQVMAGLEN